MAGTQSGKTSWGPWWLWREIYGSSSFTGKGEGDYLAVTSTYDLFKLKMLPEIRVVFEEVLKVGRYWAGDRMMELRNPITRKFGTDEKGGKMWGRIIMRSATAGSGLESATAKGAWLDEVGMDEWDITAWEAILRRLSLNMGRTLGTTTVYNSGWVKTEIYDRWIAGNPDYNVIQFPSVLNPSFPEEEFASAKERLPDWKFKMFYLGEFAKPEGLIYPDYDDEIHWIPPVEIKPYWPLTIGLDFGGVHNCTIYVYENTDLKPSEFYITDDYVEGHMPVAELVKLTKKRIGPLEYTTTLHGQQKKMIRRVTVVGGAGSEDAWRREWGQAGIYVHQPPVGDVELGILAVTELLRMKRLKIFNTRPGVRSEITSYRRLLTPDGQVSETIFNKATYHRLDAIRYFAVTGTEPQLF